MTEDIEQGHQWDLRKCIWCGKPHVKYPSPCARSIAKLVKRYGKERPLWVRQLVKDANVYLEAFRGRFV